MGILGNSTIGFGTTSRVRSTGPVCVALALMASALTAVTLGITAAPASAVTTNSLSIAVSAARTEPRALGGAGVTKGDPITEFQWLINVDNTGTTAQRSAEPGTGCSTADPGYPGSCDWPSIKEVPEPSPIYAQGDQNDFAGGAAIDLPDGRYLISVIADGYKIDGEHFTVPLEAPGEVQVQLQPDPLPDSTLKASVFADVAPTNGTMDVGDYPLVGFQGHINDILGEITTDVYGNPLCTTYVGEDPLTHEIPNSALDDGVPVVDVVGQACYSDADGILTIPHLGSNRYTAYVTPPDDERWIQTTTLEGNHDWDTWIMEGSTGFDTEFVLAGEPFPQPLFGFVPPIKNGQPLDAAASGHITGSIVGINTYTPPKGGSYSYWRGYTGSKVKHPIDRPWLSLADLNDGDQAVWVGRGNPDGSFDIAGVPDGNYMLTWWDEPQDYIIHWINVTVSDGSVEDMGVIPLNGWWTEYEGYVFNDANRNGRKDAGEKGIPNFVLTNRKPDNSLMDRGQPTAVTDANGYYFFESAYPLGEWNVLEAYSDNFYTTGITYQADNQTEPTTIKGAGVDIAVHPIIGLGGRVDWGVHPYAPFGSSGVDPDNGGIVGTVTYDTTRNELDPQYAGVEDWQPGIAGLPVELWAPVECGTTPDTACDETGRYELTEDGAFKTGQLLNTAVTEHFQRPTGCTARDVDGEPLVHGVDEDVLAPNQETDGECISAFIQGVQVNGYPTDQGTPDANFGAAVDGNYGFGDGCFTGTLDAADPGAPVCEGGDFETLPPGDYLVRVVIPDDALGRPMYKATAEEDINVGDGDQIIPQVPPPACAGSLHQVDVAGHKTDSYPPLVGDGTNGVPEHVTVPASEPVVNKTFLDIGGSIFEGTPQPRCETKLVELNNGKSIVPLFTLFTDVPLPSRLRGVIVDDINFSTDPKTTMFGEKAGVQYVPVGIYDFQNRLVTTLESDYNGMYDVLLPSTTLINCPTPSGVCMNMYRFVANDPGVPGRLNPNWNPRYRTIATEFEAMPGVRIPTDLAPTQVGLKVASPTTGVPLSVTCPQAATTPQLFAVSTPYVNGTGTFTIEGLGFGDTPGTVDLDGTVLPTSGWTNTHIDVTVPSGTRAGPHQLTITGANGAKTANGLTFHVLGNGYNPAVREVGPGRTFATIQAALDASMAGNNNDLVVVYPGSPDLANPRNNPWGAYYENTVMASPVKLQGVGPGGFQGLNYVPGSIIDASAYGGDNERDTAWRDLVDGLAWDGNQLVNDGEAVYVLASENATNANGRARQFTAAYKAAIDGFDIRGGNQRGFPGNINDITGGQTGLPPGIVTQGGAIFANAFARHLRITNNLVQNNGGAYGAIRIGTPDLLAPETDQHNENVTISDNRIIANAGTNLAGAIGVFAGADNYEIAHNEICGNFSMEYGGGVSVYGRSPGGEIHHNRIYFNESNDEGGGIMIAGQLPANPDELSPGSGSVDIYANQIQANLANDDGGGIRFLMAGGAGGQDVMNVVNNTITNNVSTHEGGGISLNDAPNVRIVNNTVMKNLTTATAVTSDGTPMPAGLSTVSNSDQLQATLPVGSPTFSNPVLFNNIFWDNRAGARAGTTVLGLGIDAGPVDNWDLGVSDATGLLAPTDSVVQQDETEHDYVLSGTNSVEDPLVVEPYDLSVQFSTWRQNPAFVDSTLVAVQTPPELMGDYHLSDCPASSACNRGAATDGGTVNAPTTDIDHEIRPALGGFDAGSDEFGSTPAPPPGTESLYFSTTGNSNPPGVGGTADDSDIYEWNGTIFSRSLDLSAAPYSVATQENLDGFARVDATHFYVSFTTTASLPGLTVQDEDVAYWNGSAWSLAFDGSANGVGGGQDVEGVNVVDGVLYFTTGNNQSPTGVPGAGDDADVYSWDGTSVARVWDASAQGLPGNADVDGLIWIDATHLYFSFSSTNTTVPLLGAVQDEDVIAWTDGSFLEYFDGTSVGLTGSNQDLDAISFANSAHGLAPAPAAAARIYISTLGTARPASGLTARSGDPEPEPEPEDPDDPDDPGVPGDPDDPGDPIPPEEPSVPETPDNADVYAWNGVTFTHSVDMTAAPYDLPPRANMDGFSRVDADHFYASFDQNLVLPGAGKVADEDVVFWDGDHWRRWFDGSRHGLAKRGQDVDAVSVVRGKLYFSTSKSASPKQVAGRGDDADIYRWNGRRIKRVWDATEKGLPRSADVDGYDRVSAGRFYVSFSGAQTRLPRLGRVPDEDVVLFSKSRWSTWLDGSSVGLRSSRLDIDALDIP